MSVIHWVAMLTAAERDAIRTIAVVFGSAFVPVFGFILTWLLRGVKKMTAKAVDNTTITPLLNGQLGSVSVAELVNRVHHDTADLRHEFRSEVSDLVNDPRTGPQQRLHGRRRDQTTITDQITRSPRYRPDVSLYTGLDEIPHE